MTHGVPTSVFWFKLPFDVVRLVTAANVGNKTHITVSQAQYSIAASKFVISVKSLATHERTSNQERSNHHGLPWWDCGPDKSGPIGSTTHSMPSVLITSATLPAAWVLG